MPQQWFNGDAPAATRHGPTDQQRSLRQVADTAPMVVWMTDRHDACIYLNKSVRALLDNSGVPNLREWFQYIHPDDLPAARAQFEHAKAMRDEYQLEYRIVRSDGTIRWMLGSGAPRFDEADEFVGYAGTVLDVTRQHEAFDHLARSEAEHRLLTENSADLIGHTGPDSTYLYVSPSYTRALGVNASELLGQNAYEFLHPDDWQVAQDEVQRQMQTGAESRTVELRKRHKSGHYVWMSTKLRVLCDPVTKARNGTVIVARDITQERQARNALLHSEARFRSLTQLSSDWYWETDKDDRFTFFSDGIQKVSGAAPQQVLGKRRMDVAVDPALPELLEYRDAIAKRMPFKNLCYEAKAPVTGARYHFCISGEPIFENGAFQGYRGVGRDITAEREMTRAMTQLAEENKALVESSPDISMLFDEKGRIVRANGPLKRLIGYESAEIIGRRYLDFVAPDSRGATQSFAATVRDGKDLGQKFENQWIRKDGTAVALSWAVQRFGQKNQTYVTARDVTERHRARVALSRANERLNSLLESIGDAFFSVDNEWRLTFANRKTAQFVNADREAAIGKVLWEVVPDIVSSSAFPYYQQAMQSRENVFFETLYEPVGRWVSVRVYPHDDGLSIFFHDITRERETERLVRESEQRLREMIAMTPVGYIATDAKGMVVDVNPSLCAMSGYSREELVGQDIMQFLPSCPMDGALHVKAGASTAHGKETVIRHKQGHCAYVLVSLAIKRDCDGNALSLTAFVTDITERKQAEARLEQLASHDTLTGLPNRELINRHLQSMLDSAKQEGYIAVLFIDLDRFKEVNDSMGHAPGDLLLRLVAQRLQKNVRQDDVIARLGGDEFVVAAYCTDGKNSAAAIAEKLLAALNGAFDVEGQEVFVGASIGISMFPSDARSKELLFQHADTAMYRAKASGRNAYRFFEAEMSVQAKRRMTLEISLRRAPELGEFELHYQPRVDLRTMQVVGTEALLRWNHPQLGRIPPLEFIPLAEERGFIESIGQWVLEEACQHTSHLVKRLGRPLQVSVNLSARQLKCPTLVGQVAAALNKASLPPELLELELTESALIEDMTESVEVLKRLKQLGILLSVDDFGTGYSGLSYLQRFPVDILKLDRSFVHQQPSGVSSFEFIKAFVDMAHALKLSVVAEGIETREILQLLRECACDEGQGYFLAKPLPFAELEAFLSTADTATGVDNK